MDFEGGGLRFASAGPACERCADGALPPQARASCTACDGTGRRPVVARLGDLTTHCGKLLHESVPVTSGVRYVLVGFVGVASPAVDTDFVEHSVHANTSTLGGWADYEIVYECMRGDED